MKRHRARLALPALLLQMAACGSGGETARTCQGDADCGAPGEAHCDRGTCVANGAPSVTVLAPAATLASNTLHRFDATAVDPEGEAVRVTWSVVAVSGGCPGDADPVEGAAFGAEVAFWCAGAYEVVATAEDPWGHSESGRAAVSVTEAAGAPTVAAGTDLLCDHLCQGEPLLCDAIGPGGTTTFSLSASGASPGGGVLTYAWKALPPPGAEEAVATFVPGPAAASPTFSLRSPGTAIAGWWSMRVRVRNEQGLLAQDVQRVLVSNRPPAIAATPASFSGNHRYEAPGYVADVPLAASATDPDGDPVEAGFALAASAAHGCSHGFAPTGPLSAQLTLSCLDPAELIGALDWTVTATVSDVNGASDARSFPLQVLNRPPAFQTEGGDPLPGHATVAHLFEPCAEAAGTCYRTAGELVIVPFDPDGDPVQSSAAPGLEAGRAHSRGAGWIDGSGFARFWFETDEGHATEFRDPDGASGFSAVVSTADPFGATASRSQPVRIANTAPVVQIAQAVVPAGHVYERSSSRYRVAPAAVAAISDPDGDPVLGGGTGDALCTLTSGEGAVQAGCELAYEAAGTVAPPLGSLAGDHPLDVAVQDGWDAIWAAVTLRVLNQAPVPNAPYTISTSSADCSCVCTDWNTHGVCILREWIPPAVDVPLRFAEPEDDPVLADGNVCLPGSCTVRRYPGTYSVPVDDGVASASVQFTLTVDCSPSGTCE